MASPMANGLANSCRAYFRITQLSETMSPALLPGPVKAPEGRGIEVGERSVAEAIGSD